MTQVRVYVPLTAPAVAGLAELGRLDAPIDGYAVTTALREATGATDDDELEYSALVAAAAAAGALRGSASTRRVVAAIDADGTGVRAMLAAPAGQEARVTLEEPVLARQIASLHVDETPTSGDEDLLWFDATELPVIVELVHSD